MNFIFDELLSVTLHNGGIGYISAGSVSAILPSDDVNECHVKVNDSDEWTIVALAPAVMASKIKFARETQARKFDKVVMALSRK